MPDYGLSDAEALALAQYFAAHAHVQPVEEPHEEPADATAALGHRRFAHFKCIQCHVARDDGQLPEAVEPEDLAINLTLAKTRLRPLWIREFLARPKAVVGMETRMPAAFYTTDGSPKVDYPDRDIDAITAYLFKMTEPPPSLPAPTDGDRPGNEHPQPIDWTKHPY
jgi:mono/diheme cytochrome c family protein